MQPQLVGFTELEKYFEVIYHRVSTGVRHCCGRDPARILELILPDESVETVVIPPAEIPADEGAPASHEPDYLREFKRKYGSG